MRYMRKPQAVIAILWDGSVEATERIGNFFDGDDDPQHPCAELVRIGFGTTNALVIRQCLSGGTQDEYLEVPVGSYLVMDMYSLDLSCATSGEIRHLYRETGAPKVEEQSTPRPCSCIREITGSWTEIGTDRICLFGTADGLSAAKKCQYCQGTGIVWGVFS